MACCNRLPSHSHKYTRIQKLSTKLEITQHFNRLGPLTSIQEGKKHSLQAREKVLAQTGQREGLPQAAAKLFCTLWASTMKEGKDGNQGMQLGRVPYGTHWQYLLCTF